MFETGLNGLIHGCDYNPEQWIDRPDILKKDIELMNKAGVNSVSIGMFSWACLEPEEGKYNLGWMEELINNLNKNGIKTILSTPSGARPVWLAKKYPEVLRVTEHMHRNLMGERHNHCYTSPVYREKVYAINTQLAKAFGNHSGVILWHLSNEYGGACYCPLCQQAFREWLKEKYKSLDSLNKAWWTTFWSHRYTSWEQIEAPVPRGERGTHGLTLDWLRFITHQTVDFCAWEKKALRDAGPALPVTTNMMEFTYEVDYTKFAGLLDVYSWDSYPEWHAPHKTLFDTAAETACFHDLMRSCKQQPFLLMESTPSTTVWRSISKIKKPGINRLASLSAVAHGADSVQYFQWRKSRGASEKFHGAIVSHDNSDNTRVFKEISQLGAELAKLGSLKGSMPKAEIAVIFDWENRWALNAIHGPRNAGMHYEETVKAHYKALWAMGANIDVVNSDASLEQYSIVCAPMLYMYRTGMAEKLRAFVEKGGTLISGCFSGIADENDLCYLEKTPYALTDVFGICAEEIDALYDGEENAATWNGKRYILKDLCERVHLNGAVSLANYESDFFAGEPVLSKNKYGDGTAYYISSCPEDAFYPDFYKELVKEKAIPLALGGNLPHNVSAVVRDDKNKIIFVQNFNEEGVKVELDGAYTEVESGKEHSGFIELEKYGTAILKKNLLF